MTRIIIIFFILFSLGCIWSQANDDHAKQLPTIDEESDRLDLAWGHLFSRPERIALPDIVQKAEERQNKWKVNKSLWRDEYEVDFSDYFYNSDLREWQKHFELGEYDGPSVVAIYRKCREAGSDAVFYRCTAFNGIHFTVSEAPDIIPWRPPKSTDKRNDSLDIAIVRPEEGVFHFTKEEPTVEISKDELVVSFPSAREFVFRRIPSGTYLAGSPESEVGRPVLKASPDGMDVIRFGTRVNMESSRNASDMISYMHFRENQRPVRIEKDFWLGQCEVTNGQFMAMYSDWSIREEEKADADKPATGYVSWKWAMEFCNQLNKACAGKLPRGYKFSLPMEMQWEWSCRAGTTTAFNNGTDMSVDDNGELTSSTEAIAWTAKENTFGAPHAVGGKAPNRFGLYDMHGNVEELCYDWVRPNPPVPGMLEIPYGSWDATSHVARGGGMSLPVFCRSAARDNFTAWNRIWGLGFRLALIPEELTPVAPSPFSDEEVRKNAVAPVSREEGLSVRLHVGVILSLEMIPAGEFEMGSPEDEIGRTTKEYWNAVYDFAPEKAETFSRHTAETRRKVAVEHAFWLGRFPVTREQYAAVIGADLSLLENGLRPMTQIRWEEAAAFCEKLNVLCADQIPQGYRFAIPTEEQWEYACRAGTTTALNNDKNLTQCDFFCPNLAEVAWFQMNSGEHKRDVGLLKPNAWGLYDMHGNVWEWCVCSTPVDDNPLSKRILRGGSWYDPPRFCRSAMRRWLDEDRGGPDIGFRVALVPMDSDDKTTEAKR